MPQTTAIRSRELTQDDTRALEELSVRLGGAETVAQWSSLLERPGTIGIAAVSEGRIVGYAAGQVRGGFGMRDAAAWVEAFGVALERRGEGVGRELMGELLRRFGQAGATHVYTLVALHDQVLGPFFRQVGFRDEPLACLGRTL